MIELNQIYNESNEETLKKMDNHIIDCVLTSPFYNTNKKAGGGRTLLNTKVKDGQYDYVRYDVFVDNMSNDDYAAYCVRLFNQFDRVLKNNGTVLWNISYGNENVDCLFTTINEIISKSNFSVVDVISWKKKSCMPNSCSPNKLSRICEFVFVFCRKNELNSFYANKEVISERHTGQKMYTVFYNFIEAANNDGVCPYNKATFSSELCEKLMAIYVKKGGVVYDPFMGSGTTAVACKRNGINYIGSEISKNQIDFALERLKQTECQPVLF